MNFYASKSTLLNLRNEFYIKIASKSILLTNSVFLNAIILLEFSSLKIECTYK